MEQDVPVQLLCVLLPVEEQPGGDQEGTNPHNSAANSLPKERVPETADAAEEQGGVRVQPSPAEQADQGDEAAEAFDEEMQQLDEEEKELLENIATRRAENRETPRNF